MVNDLKQCDPCPWPLNCCTEDGAPRPGTVAADCPREHDVWQRRLGDARLALAANSPVALVSVAEDQEKELDLVGV